MLTLVCCTPLTSFSSVPTAETVSANTVNEVVGKHWIAASLCRPCFVAISLKTVY